MNKKYINFLAAGFIALNFRLINPQLVPVASPTATPINLHLNLGKLKQVVLQFTNKRAELTGVKVLAKDSTSITVDNSGTSVKIDIQSNTHFRRKFWGSSDINEISVGDAVDVVGRWTSELKTEIKAVLIRDLSIQKRNGTFFGTVKSITDTGFVMTTIQRGEETVTLDSSTKLINRKQLAITASDIQVGQTIRVRGMWDSTSFTITEVTEVKDFSIPPFASPGALPVPTSTP